MATYASYKKVANDSIADGTITSSDIAHGHKVAAQDPARLVELELPVEAGQRPRHRHLQHEYFAGSGCA